MGCAIGARTAPTLAADLLEPPRDDENEVSLGPAGREAQVRRFIDQVWNGRNYDAAADLYAEAYTNALGSGPSARSEAIRRYHEAFPDLHLSVDELIVAGDTVVLRATFRGTDIGGYVGRSPTGRAVEEWGVTIMHFEHDRVVREWIGADKLGRFIQLGGILTHRTR